MKLPGIGERTAALIDKKIRQTFGSAGGKCSACPCFQVLTGVKVNPSNSGASSGGTASVSTLKETTQQASAIAVGTTEDQSADVVTEAEPQELPQEEAAVPKKTRKRTVRAKKYVPTFRSGAYAILLGLLELESTRGALARASKVDIIKVAQPHAEKSFTRGEAGKI